MMRKLSVSIGIPVHKSSENIQQLLKSVINQKQQNWQLKDVILCDDASNDNTLEQILDFSKKIPKKIKFLRNKHNLGYAATCQKIIFANSADILVLLNDDILLKSDEVISELVSPFKNGDITLVGGNIQTLPPTTWIGRCTFAMFQTFNSIRFTYKKGKSKFTCDGKILALKKEVANLLHLANAKVTNVDGYIYFKNDDLGGKYAFAKNAKAWFRMPETIADFRNIEERNRATYLQLCRVFGKRVEEEFAVPKSLYLKALIWGVLHFPLELVFLKLFVHNNYKVPTTTNTKDHGKWKLAMSTKNLK